MKLSIAQAIAFGQRLLAAQGVPDDIARDVAEHLVESDRVGYTSHGLSILPNYRRVLAEGFVKADGRAKLLNDRGAMLAFDGDNGFGQHVAKRSCSRPSSGPASTASASSRCAARTTWGAWATTAKWPPRPD